MNKNDTAKAILEDVHDLADENSAHVTKLESLDNLLFIIKDMTSNNNLKEQINNLTNKNDSRYGVYEVDTQKMLKSINDWN